MHISSHYSIYNHKKTKMLKVFIIVLVLLLINYLDVVLSQQNCLGQCRTVCDDDQLSPRSPNLNLSRGKKGPKGEKGDVGNPGQKGESNKHVISKYAKKVEILEIHIERQSILLEQQTKLIENNTVLIGKMSELLQNKSHVIDELSSEFVLNVFFEIY